MKILVVEDDRTVGQYVKRGLEEQRYHADLVGDGMEGLRLASAGRYDLIVLDLRLPEMNGLEVLRTLRDRGNTTPILVLTAQDAVDFKVQALRTGADDYVTKPFSVRELLGRVRAQLRRRELDRSGADGAAIESGPVSIDLARHLVTVRGEPVNLTRSEFQVLRLLAENPGQVFSRKEIMEELWQTEFRGDVRACDVHISNLRQKVESDPQNPELVLTVRRVGYRFAES
jgi:DNA-binding response OmpR family regulator